MNTEYLFVYGSLIENVNSEMNALVKKYAILMGEGSMTGKLYEVNGYPGFVPSDKSNEIVWGEVYILREAMLLFYYLDKYEQCTSEFPEPWEYKRVKFPVQLKKGEVIHNCWVYIYNRQVSRLEYILSGSYKAYMPKR
jgi:gamma-glutamylcyclotransferase (GGCT)/AIG2-like uncharacterized protein YtfP